MRKRIISLVLALIMVLTLLPVGAFADSNTVITSQPASITVHKGENASFSIAAKNTTTIKPLRYIWYDADKVSFVTSQISSNISMDAFENLFAPGYLGEGESLTLTYVRESKSIRCVVYWVKNGTTHNTPADIAFSNTAVLTVNPVPLCASHSVDTNLILKPAVASTCTIQGHSAYYICNVCGEYYTDPYGQNPTTYDRQLLPLAAAHKPMYVGVTPGTCVDKSIPAHWECRECHRCYTDENCTRLTSLAELQTLGETNPANHAGVLTHVLAVAPTCEKAGNCEYWYCEFCGGYYSNALGSIQFTDKNATVIPATGHSYVCTDNGDGTHTRACEYCHTGTVASHANTVVRDAIPATIQTEGYSGDTYCADCGALIRKGETLARLCRHTDPASGVLKHYAAVEATCPDAAEPHGGNIEYWECSECNKCWSDIGLTQEISKAATAVDIQPHYTKLLNAQVKNPLLAVQMHSDTQHWTVCKDCGYQYSAPASHAMIGAAPTCCSGNVCAVCGYDDGKLNPANHANATVITVRQANCTEQGFTTYLCTGCGETYIGSFVEPLGHSYGAWSVVSVPTCTGKGCEERVCSRCSHAETRDVAAKGHVYANDVVTAPTCTQKGYTTHECTTCGEKIIDTYVSELGHAWNSGTVIKQATEFETGLKKYICNRCGETKTEIVPKLAHQHDYRNTVVAPTCTEQGYTVHACTSCDYSYIDGYVKPLGHAEVIRYARNATCTEQGYSGDTYCTRCGVLIKVGTATPLKEHSCRKTVTPPTCSEKGYTTYTCVLCDYSYKADFVDTVPHKTEVRNTREPTCLVDGYTGDSVCTVCGTIVERGEAIEHSGHSYEDSVIAPTCTAKGYTLHTCIHCGASYTDTPTDKIDHVYGEWQTALAPTCTGMGMSIRYCECGKSDTKTVKALGHDYQNGKCTRCGELDPSYIAAPQLKLSIDTASGKPRFSWDAVDGAAKYEVYSRDGSEGDYKLLGTISSTGGLYATAVPGHKYYFKVKAISGSGTASQYSSAYYVTCDCAQPVVKLTNVASSGKIKISWNKVEGATKYEVWRATSKSGTYSKLGTTTGTSYTNTSATAGKTYYYKVKAICGTNTAGNSAFSSVHYLTCDLAAPTAKIGLSSGHPKVSWAKVTGATKYEVYRATSKNGTYSKISTTTKLSCTNTKATKGKTYYYKVKAICGTSAAASAYSNIVSIKAKK